MEILLLLFRLFPALAAVGYGTYAILEVFFPSLRDSNFNQWEVDDSGSYIQVLGWRKVLRPPRVIAQGYMSDSTACTVSFCFGTFLIIVGFVFIRHIAGMPQSLPDIFSSMHN
jgi:hypothetical protein